MKEEIVYIDCDRCGETMQITGGGAKRVIDYATYTNATLCLRCAKIRQFDDDNPIMYPTPKDTKE